MAESTTDPLEKAVLSGALFAGPDPEGREPRASGRQTGSDISDGSDDGNENDADERGFVHPSELDGDDEGSSNMAGRAAGKGSYKTGVKGVLADYREQQAANRLNNARPVPKFPSASRQRDQNGAEDEDDIFLSDSEQDARESYRRKRIEELKKMGSAERSSAAAATKGRPRFGHLREIGQSQFVKAVEEPEGVYVLVHVYDPSIPLCNAINIHLTSLARSYKHTKFIRALSTELEFASGNEEDILPTFLIYRGRENVKSLIALEKEFRKDQFAGRDDDEDDELDTDRITRARVEQLLIRHGALDASLSASSLSTDDEDSE